MEDYLRGKTKRKQKIINKIAGMHRTRASDKDKIVRSTHVHMRYISHAKRVTTETKTKETV